MWYSLAVILCAIGIGCRHWLAVLDKVLVFAGIAVFLLTFTRHCISKAKRCPNCNAIIYTGHIGTIAKQKDGMISCEKCGSLVCVDYGKRR